MKTIWAVTRDWGSEGSGSWSTPIMTFEDVDDAVFFRELVQEEHLKVSREYSAMMKAYYKKSTEWRRGGHKFPAFDGPPPSYPTAPRNKYDPANDDFTDSIDYGLDEYPYTPKGKLSDVVEL